MYLADRKELQRRPIRAQLSASYEDLQKTRRVMLSVPEPSLDGVVDPKIAELIHTECCRPGTHGVANSCGGIPPGYADQMPEVRDPFEMQRRVDDGEVFTLAESDETIWR